MAAQMQAVNGIFHNPGPSGIVLYLSAGNVRDWAYGVRGIYPTVATITAAGFEKVAETEIADRFDELIDLLVAREPAIPGRLPETTTETGSAD
jgi:hypothetical protein